MAVGRICGVCSRIVPAAGGWTQVAEGLPRFLGTAAYPDFGKEQLWDCAERFGSALARVAAGFAQDRAGIPECDLSEGRVCVEHVAFAYVRGPEHQRQSGS